MRDVLSFPDRRVCVLGLGHAGLTLAAVLADLGFQVLGVEPRADVRALLSAGKAPFREPGLAEMLGRVTASGMLRCADWSSADDVDATVFILAVGTPLDERGGMRVDMLRNAAEDVARRLSDDDLVIVRSTVGPGTTRGVVEPVLLGSGRRFHLAFCPERTMEGYALEELRRLPQIVGAVSDEAGERAERFFKFLTPAVVRVRDPETAEMVKLVCNVHRDVNFAFANEVASMCDAVGVSAREVIESGGHGYPRATLAMPGPVGGSCLPKDPHILIQSLAALGTDAAITSAARRTNEGLPARVVAHLRELAEATGFPDAPTISLLGIAFKGHPATNDLRGTVAAPVLAALRTHFPLARFQGFDAEVEQREIAEFGLEPVPDVRQAFDRANLVLVLNNHPDFAGMPIAALAAQMATPGLIYDFLNTFRAAHLRLPPGTSYVTLGEHGVREHQLAPVQAR
ncbi:nucleotide sugar dehydrogenase [Kitasatospora sp. MAP5-34]|uniref:nucleotide sugar dehydrogenase n=1 Tax=Kitasatospora sp. MAP5-34 TaxID=3035102 RepID=UPI0024738592|nr:nucleotide sugar dehydrogenase [Kitasatospora sp. MAP5-34]